MLVWYDGMGVENGNNERGQKEDVNVLACMPLSLPLPLVYCAARVAEWMNVVPLIFLHIIYYCLVIVSVCI